MVQQKETPTLEQLPQMAIRMLQELEEVKSILKQQTENTQKDDDYWMDVEQLIQYLPGHPKRQTIYCWVNAAIIPHHKPSPNRLSFRKSEIDKWLGIDTVVYNGDLDDPEPDKLLPVKACGASINRKGGLK